MIRRIGPALLILTAALLAACEDEPPPLVEQVRAIKTYTVTELASGQVRKYSGIVQATDSSAMSFQVSGNVQEVRVNLGDKVSKGQVLAILDKKPYELDVDAATAELGQAKADLEEKNVEFQRQKKLYAKKWVAKAAYDQALAAFQSAQSGVSYAQSKVNLAKRDLGNTELAAPFDGIIAERDVDPFVEVSAGQKLFEINASGALEVAFDVPEATISEITLGMPVSIALPTIKGTATRGRITEVGSVAGSANAFPIKAGLTEAPDQVRSGMTAEVSVILRRIDDASGYLVPLSAIAPGTEQRQGFVFVFDEDTSTVRRTLVRGRAGRDNWVAVTEGLNAGDIIAVAGANFLVDGQKVKLLASP